MFDKGNEIIAPLTNYVESESSALNRSISMARTFVPKISANSSHLSDEECKRLNDYNGVCCDLGVYNCVDTQPYNLLNDSDDIISDEIKKNSVILYNEIHNIYTNGYSKIIGSVQYVPVDCELSDLSEEETKQTQKQDVICDKFGASNRQDDHFEQSCFIAIISLINKLKMVINKKFNDLISGNGFDTSDKPSYTSTDVTTSTHTETCISKVSNTSNDTNNTRSYNNRIRGEALSNILLKNAGYNVNTLDYINKRQELLDLNEKGYIKCVTDTKRLVSKEPEVIEKKTGENFLEMYNDTILCIKFLRYYAYGVLIHFLLMYFDYFNDLGYTYYGKKIVAYCSMIYFVFAVYGLYTNYRGVYAALRDCIDSVIENKLIMPHGNPSCFNTKGIQQQVGKFRLFNKFMLALLFVFVTFESTYIASSVTHYSKNIMSNENTDGYCYLKLVDAQYKNSLKTELGPYPTVRKFLSQILVKNIELKYMVLRTGNLFHVDKNRKTNSDELMEDLKSCNSCSIGGVINWFNSFWDEDNENDDSDDEDEEEVEEQEEPSDEQLIKIGKREHARRMNERRNNRNNTHDNSTNIDNNRHNNTMKTNDTDNSSMSMYKKSNLTDVKINNTQTSVHNDSDFELPRDKRKMSYFWDDDDKKDKKKKRKQKKRDDEETDDLNNDTDVEEINDEDYYYNLMNEDDEEYNDNKRNKKYKSKNKDKKKKKKSSKKYKDDKECEQEEGDHKLNKEQRKSKCKNKNKDDKDDKRDDQDEDENDEDNYDDFVKMSDKNAAKSEQDVISKNKSVKHHNEIIEKLIMHEKNNTHTHTHTHTHMYMMQILGMSV
eukprot:GHVR01009638.1.p1 GENE.GHVR01009638.1~~GHVR01009638.1.p1  ORF type:complete len:935 (-),score=197.08 GHVR01009638.1:1461-3947(-)